MILKQLWWVSEGSQSVQSLSHVWLFATPWYSMPGLHVHYQLPAMWDTWVQSLGWEDPLEGVWKSMSIFLPGESPWTEETGKIGVPLQSMESQSWSWLSDWAHTNTHTYMCAIRFTLQIIIFRVRMWYSVYENILSI